MLLKKIYVPVLAIWKNSWFGQFYHPRIKVSQNYPTFLSRLLSWEGFLREREKILNTFLGLQLTKSGSNLEDDWNGVKTLWFQLKGEKIKVERLRFVFCILNFPSILSDFLSWEKLTQKWQEPKAEQCNPKIQFLNNKIDQKTSFAKLPNGYFCIMCGSCHSNWRWILKLTSKFGCLIIFCYSAWANLSKTNWQTYNLQTGQSISCKYVNQFW